MHGETFHPGDFKMAIAQLLQMGFFGGLMVALVGRQVFPEPAAKFIETNQMYIVGGCFLCNILAGNMLNSGAFEVTYDGTPVWSKIEAGRFPQLPELLDGLTAAMKA